MRDHSNRFTSNLLIDILNFVLHSGELDHLDHFFLKGFWLINVLFNCSGLFDNDHFLLVLLLRLHHNSCLLLHFLALDHLFHFNGPGLVSNLLLFADGLLENHAPDSGFMGTEDLLLTFDDAHLPSGLLSGAVFVFLMHVAVLVSMHSVPQSLRFAASRAGTSSTAGSISSLAPESPHTMIIAASATPRSLATAFAHAIFTLFQGALVSSSLL